jgi:hypothetical protein
VGPDSCPLHHGPAAITSATTPSSRQAPNKVLASSPGEHRDGQVGAQQIVGAFPDGAAGPWRAPMRRLATLGPVRGSRFQRSAPSQ